MELFYLPPRPLEPVMAMIKPLFSAATILGVSLWLLPSPCQSAPPGFLKIFGKTDAAAIDAKQLTEVDGPWMILAHSFAGENGRSQAERLADELAKEIGVQTFIHEEKFDFSGQANLPALEGRVARYANQARYQAFAVLVGEYDAIDHPNLVRDLKRVKAATPPSLMAADAAGNKSQQQAETPLDAVRNLQKDLLERVNRTADGPLRKAFATTNPMLPQEFFLTPDVDSFVAELNTPFQYNLLENRGKFTVVVATFSGLSTNVDGVKEKKFSPSGDRMAECAMLADSMVRALREKGVDAYQFHDRHSSLVTIGTFERLGSTKPNGEFEYDPAIRQVMETYCAGNRSQPTPQGAGLAPNHIDAIPFDINPMPIAVPKKSKRSLYMGRLGQR